MMRLVVLLISSKKLAGPVQESQKTALRSKDYIGASGYSLARNTRTALALWGFLS